MQTFDTDKRLMLGRVSDHDTVCRKIETSLSAGVKAVSLDLLYRLPGQTVDDFLSDVKLAVSLGVDGLSIYPLIIMKNALLEKKLFSGEIASLPEIDIEIEQYTAAREYLLESGFIQSTSTHFSRGGDRNLYNTVRLDDGDCAAIGCGAGGFYGPLVVMNHVRPGVYASAIEKTGSGFMAAVNLDRDMEFLRKISGQIQRCFIDMNSFNTDNELLHNFILNKIDEYAGLKLLEDHNGFYVLTDAGCVSCYNITEDIVSSAKEILKKTPAYEA